MIFGVSFDSLPNDLPVSYLTLVLLAFMLLGLISGIFKGFGVELLGLIKMVLVIFGSAFAVGYVQPLVAEQLSDLIPDSNTQQTVIYFVLFVAIWLVLAIIVGLIKRLFLRQLPGGLSKFFGAILGMVKWAFIGVVFAFLVVKIAGTIDGFAFFVDNAKNDPIGTLLVDSNPIIKVIDLVKEIMAK